ncbi:MAG: patatin-like phospholipase family protein [Microcystis panniformis WG22]|nr:patatin-like phospholipase family protein [Microcystis panniformis WG22]
MSNSKFLILSCDGGGIRGLITAMILQELDKHVPFLHQVDLFTGTSTGGIIALGLASGVPIADVVYIYNSKSNCSQIFNPYQAPKSDAFLDSFVEEMAKSDNFKNSIFSEIAKNLAKLMYVKYDNTGLRAVLESNLNQFDQPLSTLRSKVLVTTFQLDNESNSWQPITLDNLPKSASDDTLIMDAALCTSAAPAYFPPYEHPTYGLCIDGGVFANTPSTLALARVIGSGILEDRNLVNEDIRILSVGTGKTRNRMRPQYQPDGLLRYGLTTWFWPIEFDNTPKIPLLSIMMDGSSILDDFQAKMILEQRQYHRINVDLTEAIPLDGCSQIAAMESLVDDYIQSSAWGKNISWIQTHFLNR